MPHQQGHSTKEATHSEMDLLLSEVPILTLKKATSEEESTYSSTVLPIKGDCTSLIPLPDHHTENNKSGFVCLAKKEEELDNETHDLSSSRITFDITQPNSSPLMPAQAVVVIDSSKAPPTTRNSNPLLHQTQITTDSPLENGDKTACTIGIHILIYCY